MRRARDAAARPDRQGRDRPHAADRLGLRRLARPVRDATRSSARWLVSALRLPGLDRGLPGASLADACADATSSTGAGRGPNWTSPIRVVAVDGRGDRGARARRKPRSRGRSPATASQAAIGRDVQQRHAASAGADRPLRAAERARSTSSRTATSAAPPTAGPGDWMCNLYVYLPQPKSVPFQQTTVEYDVSVQYNGCCKASVAARLHRRPRRWPTRRAGRSPTRCSSSTAASTSSDPGHPVARVASTRVHQDIRRGRRAQPRAARSDAWRPVTPSTACSAPTITPATASRSVARSPTRATCRRRASATTSAAATRPFGPI